MRWSAEQHKIQRFFTIVINWIWGCGGSFYFLYGCFWLELLLFMETDLESAKAKISPEFFMKVLCAESEAVCSGEQRNRILLEMWNCYLLLSKIIG